MNTDLAAEAELDPAGLRPPRTRPRSSSRSRSRRSKVVIERDARKPRTGRAPLGLAADDFGLTASNTSVQIIGAQLIVLAYVVFGFNALEFAPQKRLAVFVMLLGPTMLFAPRHSLQKVAISLPVLWTVAWFVYSAEYAFLPWAWTVTATALLPMLVAMLYLASTIPPKKLGQMMSNAFAFLVVLQFGWTATHPGSSRSHADGNPGWHGSFGHKNDMTPALALAICVFLCFEPRRWVRWGGITGSVFFILMASSSTGLTAMVVLFIGYAWLRHFAPQRACMRTTIGVSTIVGSAIVVAGSLAASEQILGLYGKGLTFSGRTLIWEGVLRAVGKRPWRGYGPGIWSDQSRSPVIEIGQGISFNVFHAHNGVLELLFTLGAIGLTCYVLMFLHNMRLGWRVLDVNAEWGSFLLLAILAITITSLFEATVMGPWLVIHAVMITVGERIVRLTAERPGARVVMIQKRALRHPLSM